MVIPFYVWMGDAESIDQGDPSATDEERQLRKRRLINGPQEFRDIRINRAKIKGRSEEHTSELQSHLNLVCRLLLEKKKKDEIVPQQRGDLGAVAQKAAIADGHDDERCHDSVPSIVA